MKILKQVNTCVESTFCRNNYVQNTPNLYNTSKYTIGKVIFTFIAIEFQKKSK